MNRRKEIDRNSGGSGRFLHFSLPSLYFINIFTFPYHILLSSLLPSPCIFLFFIVVFFFSSLFFSHSFGIFSSLFSPSSSFLSCNNLKKLPTGANPNNLVSEAQRSGSVVVGLFFLWDTPSNYSSRFAAALVHD